MKKLIKTSAGILAALSLAVPGVVSANMADLKDTGPSSSNNVEVNSQQKATTENNNDLKLDNSTSQDAKTGSATAEDSTTAGDAGSGDAENMNDMSVAVDVDNSGSTQGMDWGMGSGEHEATIENTGPDSDNNVEFNSNSELKITNDNKISISNSVDQTSKSGDAKVSHNTTGGDAMSGNASNTSTTEFTLSVKN